MMTPLGAPSSSYLWLYGRCLRLLPSFDARIVVYHIIEQVIE